MGLKVGGDHWGMGQPRRTFGEKHWAQLTRWNKIYDRRSDAMSLDEVERILN
jgi:hypothetical protein